MTHFLNFPPEVLSGFLLDKVVIVLYLIGNKILTHKLSLCKDAHVTLALESGKKHEIPTCLFQSAPFRSIRIKLREISSFSSDRLELLLRKHCRTLEILILEGDGITTHLAEFLSVMRIEASQVGRDPNTVLFNRLKRLKIDDFTEGTPMPLVSFHMLPPSLTSLKIPRPFKDNDMSKLWSHSPELLMGIFGSPPDGFKHYETRLQCVPVLLRRLPCSLTHFSGDNFHWNPEIANAMSHLKNLTNLRIDNVDSDKFTSSSSSIALLSSTLPHLTSLEVTRDCTFIFKLDDLELLPPGLTQLTLPWIPPCYSDNAEDSASMIRLIEKRPLKNLRSFTTFLLSAHMASWDSHNDNDLGTKYMMQLLPSQLYKLDLRRLGNLFDPSLIQYLPISLQVLFISLPTYCRAVPHGLPPSLTEIHIFGPAEPFHGLSSLPSSITSVHIDTGGDWDRIHFDNAPESILELFLPNAFLRNRAECYLPKRLQTLEVYSIGAHWQTDEWLSEYRLLYCGTMSNFGTKTRRIALKPVDFRHAELYLPESLQILIMCDPQRASKLEISLYPFPPF